MAVIHKKECWVCGKEISVENQHVAYIKGGSAKPCCRGCSIAAVHMGSAGYMAPLQHERVYCSRNFALSARGGLRRHAAFGGVAAVVAASSITQGAWLDGPKFVNVPGWGSAEARPTTADGRGTFEVTRGSLAGDPSLRLFLQFVVEDDQDNGVWIGGDWGMESAEADFYVPLDATGPVMFTVEDLRHAGFTNLDGVGGELVGAVGGDRTAVSNVPESGDLLALAAALMVGALESGARRRRS